MNTSGNNGRDVLWARDGTVQYNGVQILNAARESPGILLKSMGGVCQLYT